MALLFWSEEQPPTVRQYPMVLFRAALGGALFGPVLSTVLILAFQRPLAHAFDEWPKMLALSSYGGAVFSLCFFVCCGLPWHYLRPLLKDYPANAKGAITAVVGALGAMLAFSMAVVMLSPVPEIHFWGREHFGQMLGVEAGIGAILALLIGTFKTMQRQIRSAEATLHEREMREHALGEAAAKAQSFALQAQINPHFFFNTLNTLSALIPVKPEAAQEMVGRLAEMFRYTLACSRSADVTLTQELAFVDNYLELERARFSERLRITMPTGDFNDIHLPGLSLQPLVENAIRHGIAKRIEGGEVEISVHRNGRQCSVDVANPAEQLESAEFFREGHALANVRERLALYAGKGAGVRVATDEPGHVRVSLVLPLEHAQ